MLFVDEILYRKISPADFKNIEYVKKPARGGGQTYIDLSNIELDRVVEFCSKGTYLKPGMPTKQGRTYKTDTYELNVVAVGTLLEETIAINLRRPTNYSIVRQALHLERHPAWTANQGFPTIVGPGMPFKTNSCYDDESLDPYVRPITDVLSIYIVRTLSGYYFASYLYGDSIPESWPQDAGLQQLLASNWEEKKKEEGRGIYKPPYLLEFMNSREGTFQK